MPFGPDIERPLTRAQISTVLAGIADSPPAVPPSVRQAALSATIDGLSLWCDVDDVLSAAAKYQPSIDLRGFVS